VCLATSGPDATNLLTAIAQLGMVRQQQQLFYGARDRASRFKGRTHFVAMRAASASAQSIWNCPDDPAETLAATLRQPGPCLINVPIAGDENVYPMVPPVRAIAR
jgi:acetolactate synthase-1/2/3 large subunit